MAELGHPLPTPQVVLWDRARLATRALLGGETGAREAAGEIAALLCKAGHCDEQGRWSDFATRFELLCVDWDDLPADRDKIAEDIRVAARELLVGCEQLSRDVD